MSLVYNSSEGRDDSGVAACSFTLLKCTIPFGSVHRSIRWALLLFLSFFLSCIHDLRSMFRLLSSRGDRHC